MASELYLQRNPLMCPIDSCKKKHVFLSDFSKHMICDHPEILHEFLRPESVHKFKLNQMENSDENFCQYFYLVTEKIRYVDKISLYLTLSKKIILHILSSRSDLGGSVYKNYLPILVMSKIVNLANIIESSASELNVIGHNNNYQEINDRYYILWLTGITTTDLPIFYTVTAWNVQKESLKPTLMFVSSGKLYSLRDNQDIKMIYRSSSAIIIPIQLVHQRRKSKPSQNSIEIQVVIH